MAAAAEEREVVGDAEEQSWSISFGLFIYFTLSEVMSLIILDYAIEYVTALLSFCSVKEFSAPLMRWKVAWFVEKLMRCIEKVDFFM